MTMHAILHKSELNPLLINGFDAYGTCYYRNIYLLTHSLRRAPEWTIKSTLFYYTTNKTTSPINASNSAIHTDEITQFTTEQLHWK